MLTDEEIDRIARRMLDIFLNSPFPAIKIDTGVRSSIPESWFQGNRTTITVEKTGDGQTE